MRLPWEIIGNVLKLLALGILEVRFDILMKLTVITFER